MRNWILILLASMLLASTVRAEDRALLIGIGNYKNPSQNLPGIDKDLDAMQFVAAKMGFLPNQTKVLKDSAASLNGIRNAIKTWLIQGVGPNDRVLLYYSGHGASVPDQDPKDEADGFDEVLIPWDSMFVNHKLVNYLVDDEVGDLLAAIPSKNVLVIFDSCHSGTATKSVSFNSGLRDNEFIPKLLLPEPLDSSKGMLPKPNSTGSQNFTPRAANSSMNYVGIMAARDDESANATKNGSVFTLALKRVFDSNVRSISAQLLIEEARKACKQYVTENRLPSQQPQLNGDQARFNFPLFGRRAITSPPSTPLSRLLTEWETAADAAPIKLRFEAGQSVYAPRQMLTVKVSGTKAGYLYIINVGNGEDSATLLFPNEQDSQNQVSGGQTVTIPSNTRWRLPASLPPGMDSQKVLLIAVISPQPIDMSKGFAPAGIFKQMDGAVPRSFAVEANQDGSRAAGKVFVEVRK